MKNRREIFLALSNITQLGLSVVISFLIWIGITSWLQKTFSLGNFVVVIGIVLGAGSAAVSFVKFCNVMSKKENNNEN